MKTTIYKGYTITKGEGDKYYAVNTTINHKDEELCKTEIDFMLENEKEPEQLVIFALNQIKQKAQDLADEWDRNRVPLKMVELNIDTLLIDEKPEGLGEFVEAFNNICKSLKSHFIDIAKEFKTESIPLSEIHKTVDYTCSVFRDEVNKKG